MGAVQNRTDLYSINILHLTKQIHIQPTFENPISLLTEIQHYSFLWKQEISQKFDFFHVS